MPTLTEKQTYKVISKDGTAIAFGKKGQGPAVVLVDGSCGSRTFGPNVGLAPLLAEHFTVYTYDRRGRGESGDSPEFAVEREIEDLAAVIKEAGGEAAVYGISSGAALVLEAANRDIGITKAAVYEVPYIVDDSRPALSADYHKTLADLIAADRRGDALKYFMKVGARVPGFFVAILPLLPQWGKLKGVAHTVPYDAALLKGLDEGRPLPADRFNDLTAPTLAIVGGRSPDWIKNTMDELAQVLPNARHHLLKGQMHVVKPKAIAPVLVEFFAE